MGVMCVVQQVLVNSILILFVDSLDMTCCDRCLFRCQLITVCVFHAKMCNTHQLPLLHVKGTFKYLSCPRCLFSTFFEDQP